MFDVRFLGCNGSLQERGGGNTSLLVSSESTTILVDVSSNIQEAVEGNIDYVFITHSHIDHCYGLPSLLHQLWLSGRKRSLTVYAPKEILPLLEAQVSLFALREKKNFFDLFIEEARAVSLSDIDVHPFKTDHTNASIGLFFLDKKDNKKLLYTSDTRPIKEVDLMWMDSDILIHESSGISLEEDTLVRKGHSSALDAADLASRINCKKLILCHLPNDDEIKKKIEEEAQSVFLQASLPVVFNSYIV